MEVSTNPEHIEGDPLDGGHGDEDVGRLRGVDQLAKLNKNASSDIKDLRQNFL